MLVTLDNNLTTESNYLGNFSLNEVDAGWYILTFKKDGYYDSSQELNVIAGKIQTLRIALINNPNYEEESSRSREDDSIDDEESTGNTIF